MTRINNEYLFILNLCDYHNSLKREKKRKALTIKILNLEVYNFHYKHLKKKLIHHLNLCSLTEEAENFKKILKTAL